MRAPALRLFTLSFTALFLELMVIRWVPSEIRLVAYYANLMLVSSFLGLGLGALLTARERNVFRFFPLLLAVNIGFLTMAGALTLPSSTGEMRFTGEQQRAASYVALVLIFLLNAALFVPLGEQIGVLFQRLPPLRAYGWDLLGSLAGTIAFGAFSFLYFSPVAGLAIVVGLMLLTGPDARRAWAWPLYALALVAVAWSGGRERTWWSPYYFITARENRLHVEQRPGETHGVAWFEEARAETPPADIRTRRDPPVYTVRVNQDFYQMHGTLDPARYTPGRAAEQLVGDLAAQYALPYHLAPSPARVLVLGAGGGMDVEMALLRGAHRVDAVEIDPVIARLSDRFSAAAPYADPRVVLHVDDARAFLQRSRDTFDLVVFGHLDSQALSSYGASLRLDGYIYTVEGFRAAYARLVPGGTLSLSFSVMHEWMAQKIAQMIEQATGAPPLVYVRTGTVTFIAQRTPPSNPPPEIGAWKLRRVARQPVDLATDDWPYLYLAQRTLPPDYAVVIAVLLLVSVGALRGFQGEGLGTGQAHFLFLGWGFLLLQTKSITDCALYFGTTWVVTTIVIAGVLLMVLLANAVALRWVKAFRFWLYAPLLAALLVVIAVPREWILGWSLAGRATWTLLVVPLPIFFAGLIFSSTLRDAARPAQAVGANLIGATIGGFCEYLGMWTGSRTLGAIVIAAYAASLLCRLRERRAEKRPLPPAGFPVHSTTR